METSNCYSLIEVMRSIYRVNEDELREIASCCLFGLYYLHQHNIMHRVSDWDDG